MKKFGNFYSYFVLIWFTLVGLFNGVIGVVFRTSVSIGIGTIFVLGLFFISPKVRKITQKEILFTLFYLCVTFIFLIYYFTNNHYGIVKLIQNMILTIVLLFDFVILYKEFRDATFNKIIKRIFALQIILELGFYIFYVLYNKINGILGKSIVQIIILQDWTGRFQGTFSEPSILGVWLGVAAFISVLVYNTKFLFFSFSFILFSACKAKFALIALPFALFISLFYKFFINCNKSKMNLFLFFFAICLMTLFIEDIVFYFFSLLKKIVDKEGSGTYVTRFGFLFASIENCCCFPFGTGIGLNYEAFQNLFTSIVPVANRVGLEIFELQGYVINPNKMGSKDTFSFVLSQFGFVGLYVFLDYFTMLFSKKYVNHFFAFALISFALIESIITTNLFSPSIFFIFLFARMALNEVERK